MAETPFPIPASIRQNAVFVGSGATTYGPFGEGWGIFDTADVLVETRAAVPGTDPWVPATVTVEKTDPAAAYSNFNITFAAAITSATQIRVSGDRLPRRELAISKGQSIDVDRLEQELSSFIINLQENRRLLKSLPGIVAGDAASQAAAAAADAEAALDAIEALAVDPTGYLSKAGNLAGLASQATARTNLGLGSAAVQASTAFATAAHTHPAAGVTGGIKGFHRNLRTVNDGVTPLTKMLVTADELIVKDAGGIGLLLNSVNVAITMGAPGLNSLDAGAEAASTWYYIWVISDGTNVAGVFSTSSVDCATLGAYTYKALVGAVYNDAGSNFRSTFSNGRIVEQTDEIVYNANGITGVWTLLSLATAIPGAAFRAMGRTACTVNNGQHVKFSPFSTGVGPGLRSCTVNTVSLQVDGQYPGDPLEVPIVTPQTVWHKSGQATNTIIIIHSFELPMAGG